MEEIPRPLAQPEELLALRPLRLGAVPPVAERPPPRRGPVAQRRAHALLVLGPGPPPGAAAVSRPAPGVRGRRGRGLVAAVVHQLRQQLRAPRCELRLRVLGRLVLSRARRGRPWRGWRGRRVPWRRGGRSRAAGVHGVVAGRLGGRGETVAEDVADGRQPVVRLVGRHVVDVGCARQPRRLVRNVPRQRLGVVNAGKGLVQGRRLDDALGGELLV